MAISVEKRITAELEALRTVRPDMGPDDAVKATARCHRRINHLLDEWEAQHSHVKPKPKPSTTPS